MGLAKAFLEQYPWQRFEPHPEWAALAPGASSPSNDVSFQPQATGIPGLVRVVYVPEPQAIELRDLGSRAKYAASWFDPVSGEKTAVGVVQSDDTGVFRCSPPKGDHDWVLVLDKP